MVLQCVTIRVFLGFLIWVFVLPCALILFVHFQGGIKAPQHRFPYMVSIKTSEGHIHKCGGILIDPKWILTAAHCNEEIGDHPFVHIGAYMANDSHLTPGVQVYMIVALLRYPFKPLHFGQ